MKKAPKRGRPSKDPAERFQTPARQLGRVSDADWAELQAAAAAVPGRSFTQWAVDILLRAARRQARK